MPAAKNDNTNTNALSENDASDNHVAGGFKATLSNPNSSEEAKKHAQEMLDKAGVDADSRADPSGRRDDLSEEDKHKHHVEGGYKATLSNPKSSEEAKKHAQEMLDKIANGEELPESEKNRSSGRSDKDASDSHVAGGYKATLSNPNSSEEAKKHAQEMLDKAGVDADERASTSNSGRRDDLSEEDKHKHHVEGGYKATLSNPKSSEEAKKHAQEMLDKISKGEELPESEKTKNRASYNKSKGDQSEDDKHNNHVLGGYKATLSNPNSSEEAKKHAQEMIDQHESGEKKGLKRSNDDVDHKKESSPKKSKSDDSKTDETEFEGKGKQGFASMPKEKVKEIASKGGRTKNAGEEPTAVKNQ